MDSIVICFVFFSGARRRKCQSFLPVFGVVVVVCSSFLFFVVVVVVIRRRGFVEWKTNEKKTKKKNKGKESIFVCATKTEGADWPRGCRRRRRWTHSAFIFRRRPLAFGSPAALPFRRPFSMANDRVPGAGTSRIYRCGVAVASNNNNNNNNNNNSNNNSRRSIECLAVWIFADDCLVSMAIDQKKKKKRQLINDQSAAPAS